MNNPRVCSHCAGLLSEGTQFCPACGHLPFPKLANWFDRVCAAAVDVSLFVAVSGLLMWLGLKWWVIFLTWFVFIEIGYQLQGSIGKSFVGISIPIKSRFQFYLRETIGKLASLAIFGIGFLIIFSKERLALHDYMAKTRVLRVVSASTLRQAIIGVSLFISLVVGTYFLLRTEHPNSLSNLVHTSEPSALGSLVKQMPAVATMYVYNGQGKPVGQGSGFLITSDGVGVTNFHVIKDAYSADAKLGDGRLYHVLAIHAYNEDRDIAIFQLGRKMSLGVEPARELPHLTVSTEEVRIGDRVTTVGSPEGLSNSVSDGLVSAIRTVGEKQFFQITAPISPGSSGGPVFNLKGEVVGISSFQLVEGQNLNFAIPIDEAVKIKEQRANLTLEQIYWQTHPSREARSAAKTQTETSEQPLASPRTATRSVTGTYLGTVHNLTADSSAGFGIFIEEGQGLIWGCMAVKMPLVGSGPLYGSAEGTNLTLNVTSSGFTMNFAGIREGNRVTGTYTVERPNGSSEQGEFILKKKDSNRLPKDFDPLKDCPTDAQINE